MHGIISALQLISGLLTAFFILIHEPKSEGLGAIGSAASGFKGVRTSADEKLDNITWFFVIIFLLSSVALGFRLV